MRAFTGLDQFYPYVECLERLMQAILSCIVFEIVIVMMV